MKAPPSTADLQERLRVTSDALAECLTAMTSAADVRDARIAAAACKAAAILNLPSPVTLTMIIP